MKALESPIVSTAAGGIAFLLTWMLTLQSAAPNIRPAAVAHKAAAAPGVPAAPTYPVESWVYYNPEVDQLIKDLKAERDALTAREEDLKQLAARLTTERSELDQVADSVKKMQAEIEKRLVEIKADEIPNLKRLAKTYSSMSPAGAAAILREMEDNAVVKILALMKDTENGPILEGMGRQGPADATRAAALTEKLRLARVPATKAKP
jgi:flagellar motility protein MotE (MotC chaperone)